MKFKTTQDAINYIEKILEKYNIDSTSDDVFMHAFNENEDKAKAAEKTKSILEKGLKKAHGSMSIFSTLAPCDKDKPLGPQIECYRFKFGNYKVIVHIPKTLEDIFFGVSRKEGSLKDHRHCLFDFLSTFDHVPSEFIVGVFYVEGCQVSPEVEFVENPNYFAHPTNSKKNTKSLLNKIHEAIKKEGPVLKHLMSTETKFDNKEHWLKGLDQLLDFFGFDFVDNLNSFVEQRIEFDNSKNDVLTQ